MTRSPKESLGVVAASCRLLLATPTAAGVVVVVVFVVVVNAAGCSHIATEPIG